MPQKGPYLQRFNESLVRYLHISSLKGRISRWGGGETASKPQSAFIGADVTVATHGIHEAIHLLIG